MRVPAIVGVIGERISDIPNNDFEEIHIAHCPSISYSKRFASLRQDLIGIRELCLHRSHETRSSKEL
jgi:hypothetical protein